MAKSSAPLFCRCCGKPIAKRTSYVWVKDAEPPEFGTTRTYDYTTGEWFERQYRISHGRYVVAAPKTKADCQKLVNEKVVSIQRNLDRSIRSFGIWDGESYVEEFFCSNKCAMAFADMVARNHPTIRTKRAAEAEEMRRGEFPKIVSKK